MEGGSYHSPFGRVSDTQQNNTRGMIMEFVWDAGCNYPIAIHVTEEGLYPSLQSLADHEDLPVRYLPTNEDFYPQ